MIASSPPFAISRVQTSTLRRAASSAASSRPIWCTSEPQQVSPLGTTTSTPTRVSSRIAASLMPGSSTDCAQPVRIATRPRRAPVAACTAGADIADFLGKVAGASASIAAKGFSTAILSRIPAKRTAEPRQRQRGAEAAGMRQHPGQHGAGQPVEQRPPVGLLDMRAGMVDQVHVIDARRAGRHAGEAGQAAVDMGDDLLVRRAAVLQHVLDQVDAAARANRARCRRSRRSGRSPCRSRNARICAGSFRIPRHAGRRAGRG